MNMVTHLDELFSHTRQKLETLTQLCSPQTLGATEDSVINALYEYYGQAIEYGSEIITHPDSFVDYWYNSLPMGVLYFIPDVGHLLDNLEPLKYRDSRASSSSEAEKQEAAMLQKASALPHKTRQFTEHIIPLLVRLGYKDIICPGDDIPSVRKRLDLLKRYSLLIEESVNHYGLSKQNPAVLLAQNRYLP